MEDSNVCMFKQLPLELVEHVILKSTVQLFEEMRREKLRMQNSRIQDVDACDVAAVTCLGSVSSDWWGTMCGWKESRTSLWFRHKLRRLLFQCRPYRYRLRELTRLDPGQSGQEVHGLASTHDKLYIARHLPHSRLVVFSLSANYKQLDDLDVTGLGYITDLAADNDVLYIADMTGVWRIVASKKQVAEKWIELKDAGGLSVTPAGQLVVLSYADYCHGSAVSVYTREGVLDSQIHLPDSLLNAWHAALTASGSFVVSHGDRYTDQHGVSLVSRDGAITASYGQQPGSGSGQVNWPCHIALDTEDRVFVCDNSNRRVLLLDSKLNFRRVLLDLSSFDDGCRPWRLWFDRRKATLFVGFNYGLVVIYGLD